MSNPTTPFSWQMPTATDLVTDLPADFQVFGQAVATSMQDLLGGASGYILSKASATDMDFAWIANDQGDITGVTAGTGISGGGTSGTVTVTNSMATAYTTKGDLVPATASSTFARLGVGANNTVLTADSAEATGMKWATPSSGGTFSAWTPSYTNITVGNGTVVARYTQTGKSVFAYWKFTLGSTSSYGNAARISLPVTATSVNFRGEGYGLDAGTVEVIGQAYLHSTTLMNLQVPLNGSYGSTQASATFPWTWTTNDEIILCIQYEAA